MDGLTFLDRAANFKPRPVVVLHGDEDFLKRQVKAALRRGVLGDEDDGFGYAAHDGTTASLGAVLSDVRTPSLLSPRRLVVVENADPFVTRERAKLEKY